MVQQYRLMSRGGEPDRRCVLPAKRTDRRRFQPAFWGSLSDVWLTPHSLREHNLRNKKLSPSKPKTQDVVFQDVAQFARHGGPDLGDIRGYPRRPANTRATGPDGQPDLSSRAAVGMTESFESGPPCPYDVNYEQLLIDNHIWVGYIKSRPNNLAELEHLMPDRAMSEIPWDRFLNSGFYLEDFDFAHDKLRSEGDVMRTIIPTIAGHYPRPYPNGRNVIFNNMDTMTNGTKAHPKPIFYEGARPRDLHPSVASDLDSLIVPSKAGRSLVAPNLFLEAKPLWRGTAVAIRKAHLDGAYGARAMHALQNYGREEPVYDGDAYTFTFIYNPVNAGLKIYAHHVTAPETPGGPPDYHMTFVKCYWMTHDLETYIQGVLAFRDIRDLAKAHRDHFIEEANSRASGATATGPD